MTNTKISALPAATNLAGTELLPLVQGGATKQTTVAQLLALVVAGAPAALATLKQIADAIGDDATEYADLVASIAAKASTAALTAETTRATASEALKAPLASPAFTGTPTVSGTPVAKTSDLITLVDNGDGTVTLSGNGVTVNPDGTFTVAAPGATATAITAASVATNYSTKGQALVAALIFGS